MVNLEQSPWVVVYTPTPHKAAFAENLLGTLLQELFSETVHELHDWSFYFINHTVFSPKASV